MVMGKKLHFLKNLAPWSVCCPHSKVGDGTAKNRIAPLNVPILLKVKASSGLPHPGGLRCKSGRSPERRPAEEPGQSLRKRSLLLGPDVTTQS